MNLLVRKAVYAVKNRELGLGRSIRLSPAALAELDKVFEKELTELLRAAVEHTKAKKRKTIYPEDLAGGLNDYRKTFLPTVIAQVQQGINAKFEELKRLGGEQQ